MTPKENFEAIQSFLIENRAKQDLLASLTELHSEADQCLSIKAFLYVKGRREHPGFICPRATDTSEDVDCACGADDHNHKVDEMINGIYS